MLEEQNDAREGETGYDLIPTNRRQMLVCMYCAKLTNQSFTTLYEHTSYADVIEQLALALAANYTPPESPQ